MSQCAKCTGLCGFITENTDTLAGIFALAMAVYFGHIFVGMWCYIKSFLVKPKGACALTGTGGDTGRVDSDVSLEHLADDVLDLKRRQQSTTRARATELREPATTARPQTRARNSRLKVYVRLGERSRKSAEPEADDSSPAADQDSESEEALHNNIGLVGTIGWTGLDGE